MTFMTGLLIIIFGGMAVGAIAEIAKAIARRGASASELSQLKRQLQQYTAALEEAQATLASQATQLAELQERIDFAERLLTQARDRPVLGGGPQRQ